MTQGYTPWPDGTSKLLLQRVLTGDYLPGMYVPVADVQRLINAPLDVTPEAREELRQGLSPLLKGERMVRVDVLGRWICSMQRQLRHPADVAVIHWELMTELRSVARPKPLVVATQ